MHRTASALTALLFTLALQPALADEPRTVAVSGTASATVAPDRARVDMSIAERDASLASAQAAANAAAAKVLAVLDGLGIERQRINTTAAMIRPNYRWNREREEQELLGYIVERNITVELRDLDKLGLLIERATQAGVNQLSPPQLESSKSREVYREALGKAVADARANAEVLANASGNKVGDALSINAGHSGPVPLPRGRVMADMAVAEGAAETYVPGEIRFDATVSIVYELTQ